MKQIFTNLTKLGLLTLTLVSFSACNDDDSFVEPIAIATCDDGIMNGTETGIDCGGSCAPCSVPVVP